ncbi:Hypothetical predicted protein [Cloeon dipterum]|uniref:Uncharacterized protein n=1 Tax=Cloeon dipterum TaxID=197152 RepID=A0A8S1D028_9INSE|nr:Hypothetical predicted protein [Cloeon dipterum]
MAKPNLLLVSALGVLLAASVIGHPLSSPHSTKDQVGLALGHKKGGYQQDPGACHLSGGGDAEVVGPLAEVGHKQDLKSQSSAGAQSSAGVKGAAGGGLGLGLGLGLGGAAGGAGSGGAQAGSYGGSGAQANSAAGGSGAGSGGWVWDWGSA